MNQNTQRGTNTMRFFASLVLCFSAASIGSYFTRAGVSEWYVFLKKPVFTPPNEIFAPAWTLLYFLMALSLYLIWRKGLVLEKERMAFGLFIIHLIFNAFWSVVFFGFHEILLALVVIIMLWLIIFSLVVQFYKIEKFASFLLIPYLAWVSYAVFLNFFVWLLNK